MNNIAAKLVQVMAECGSVRKNGTNDYHQYKYATSADVLEKVNTALVKQNIAAVVLSEIMSSDDVINAKGNIEHLVTVRVSITLIDAASGESLQLSGMGSGQDSGDKAVMKAQTAAVKYAYMLTLAMSANDDPEADIRTDEAMTGQKTAKPNQNQPALVCSECDAAITIGIQQVSMKRFGRALCMKCQKRAQVAS